MEGFKRSTRNEQAIPEQRNWAWERDDWSVWQRAERTNFQWRIYCAIQEQRYEDISDLEDAMIDSNAICNNNGIRQSKKEDGLLEIVSVMTFTGS